MIFVMGCQSTDKRTAPEEAQSAVGVVAEAISGQNIKSKYCPLCGRHFSSRVENCPKDNTKLLEVED
ncbi:MAG: hypothetical protein WC676_00055 [Candidatus Omnitrophota bacterium]